MRLVLVEWEDSHQSRGWEELSEIRDEVAVCRSVGWLVHDGERAVVIAPHLSVPTSGIIPQGTGVMTVPTRSVLRLVDLVEATSPLASALEAVPEPCQEPA